MPENTPQGQQFHGKGNKSLFASVALSWFQLSKVNFDSVSKIQRGTNL
jgi:hypothetical protein